MGGTAIVRGGVIEPSPETLPDHQGPPFIVHEFALKPTSVARIRTAPWSFGFGAFSEIVYRDHYSRRMPSGRQEEWADTVLRAIDGVISIRKDWHVRNHLPWDEGRWQELAEEMALGFLQLRWSPPGRGIFAMGTPLVRKRGGASLNNCGASKVHVATMNKDLGWIMSMLMHGVGVGVECIPRPYLLGQPSGEILTYVVPDTREGWVESVEILARSYMHGSNPVRFDYSQLREAGAILKTFGGTSSGPEALEKLHSRMRETFSRYVRDEITSTRLVADTANQVGAAAVAGGARRTAMILIGSPRDQEFLDLKDYTRFPEREAWGWVSNNSVRLEKSEDFELIPEIAARMRVMGEPGLLNLIALQKFARFGREKHDPADLVNPCTSGDTLILTNQGEVEIASVVDQEVTIWNGWEWSKVIPRVTGRDQPLTDVKLSDGRKLTCTPAHEWLVLPEGKKATEGLVKVPTRRLQEGDIVPTVTQDRLRGYAMVQSITNRMTRADKVYCFTDPLRHTGTFNGIVTGQCGEQGLENAELCTLSDVYPSRCSNASEVVRSEELACIYASIVALLPTHSEETNRVMARNRRIGVSLSGVADWGSQVTAAEMTRTMRRGYRAMETENIRLALEAGVRPSIRIGTSKPGGTTALLAGVSPGGHFAIFEYYIRRKRVSVNSPIRSALIAAGYPYEKDAYADDTDVFEFPLSQPGVRTASQAGMHEQALQACMLQREHSDNAVSFTLTWNEQEGQQLSTLLAQIAPMMKSISGLPRDTHKYKQAPYEEITREEFERRSAAVKPIDWSAFRGDGQDEKYCQGGVCVVPK